MVIDATASSERPLVPASSLPLTHSHTPSNAQRTRVVVILIDIGNMKTDYTH